MCSYRLSAAGLLYLNVLILDSILVCDLSQLEGHSPAASFFCIVFFLSIIYILLRISRKPQNRWAPASAKAERKSLLSILKKRTIIILIIMTITMTMVMITLRG